MANESNPALGDESLAAKFAHGINTANTNPEVNKVATYFWQQAQHLGETGLSYASEDAKELFEKLDSVLTDEQDFEI